MPKYVNCLMSGSEAKSAVVISDVCGTKAGAYVATLLLCRELSLMGYGVTCFAGTVDRIDLASSETFRIVVPVLNKGWRWDWPHRLLALQARRFVRQQVPDCVFAVGMTRLTRFLLQSDVARQVMIWELTNADPGNKFVDGVAIRQLSRAKAMISPSSIIDMQIRKHYCYQGNILRLPFWIEEKLTESQVPLMDPGFDFIFLGRRDEDKGLRELVEATAMVSGDFPEVNVLIGGMGDATPFEVQANQLGVRSSLTFHTFTNRLDVMTALARARCLILPSYHEGYPLVLLEAARSGVPMIATTVGSIPEMFRGCPACRLVPPHDTVALAKAMRSALTDSVDQFRERSQAAKDRFQALSSQSAVAKRLKRILIWNSDDEGK